MTLTVIQVMSFLIPRLSWYSYTPKSHYKQDSINNQLVYIHFAIHHSLGLMLGNCFNHLQFIVVFTSRLYDTNFYESDLNSQQFCCKYKGRSKLWKVLIYMYVYLGTSTYIYLYLCTSVYSSSLSWCLKEDLFSLWQIFQKQMKSPVPRSSRRAFPSAKQS